MGIRLYKVHRRGRFWKNIQISHLQLQAFGCVQEHLYLFESNGLTTETLLMEYHFSHNGKPSSVC